LQLRCKGTFWQLERVTAGRLWRPATRLRELPSRSVLSAKVFRPPEERKRACTPRALGLELATGHSEGVRSFLRRACGHHGGLRSNRPGRAETLVSTLNVQRRCALAARSSRRADRNASIVVSIAIRFSSGSAEGFSTAIIAALSRTQWFLRTGWDQCVSAFLIMGLAGAVAAGWRTSAYRPWQADRINRVSNAADMTAQKNGAPVPVTLLYAVTGQVGGGTIGNPFRLFYCAGGSGRGICGTGYLAVSRRELSPGSRKLLGVGSSTKRYDAQAGGGTDAGDQRLLNSRAPG
jgi:hypothetical protein